MRTMNKVKTQQTEQERDDSTKMYELGYLLVPTIKEDEIEKSVEVLRSAIRAEYDKDILSEGTPSLITLAYKMEQVVENKKAVFDTAFFGWIRFNTTASEIKQLKEELDKNKSVLRFLIIKIKEDNSQVEKNTEKSTSAVKKDITTSTKDIKTQKTTKTPKTTEVKEAKEVTKDTLKNKEVKQEKKQEEIVLDKTIDEAIEDIVVK